MLHTALPQSVRREFCPEGTGGRITITSRVRDAVEKAAREQVASIDHMRSPHVALGPLQKPDGEWLAQVVYFGLD